MPDGTEVVKEIKLNITGSLPGEQLGVALFTYLTKSRDTMSQATRDAWDERGLRVWDRWEALWVSLGVSK